MEDKKTLTEQIPQPKTLRQHECGNVVNEATGLCPQCHQQLTESTARPILFG